MLKRFGTRKGFPSRSASAQLRRRRSPIHQSNAFFALLWEWLDRGFFLPAEAAVASTARTWRAPDVVKLVAVVAPRDHGIRRKQRRAGAVPRVVVVRCREGLGCVAAQLGQPGGEFD
jgi:hypothetical protein